MPHDVHRTKPMALRIPEGLRLRLRAHAAGHSRTMTSVVVEAITAWLDRSEAVRLAMSPPSAEQCSAGEIIEAGGQRGVALWWPQMGGYAGKAVLVLDDECCEILVWHDGVFPFDGTCQNCGDDRQPVRIHLHDPEDWVRLGRDMESALGKLGA